MFATALLLIAALAPTASDDKLRPISEADGVIAVYQQDWGLASTGEPKLVIAAWSDGTVVWAEDQVEGGPPYRRGSVAPQRVAAVLERLELDGAFDDRRLAQPCLGFDSKFTTLLIKKGKLKLEMNSWHEIFERNGRAIAGSCALFSLPEGKRLSELRKEPAEFLYYRAVWGEIRTLTATLIPAEGKPTSGEAYMRGGVFSWRESAVK